MRSPAMSRRPAIAAGLFLSVLANAGAATASLPARLPVEFEANHGQHDPAVRYLARAGGYRLFLTDRGAVMAAGQGEAVAMEFAGAKPARIEPQEASQHRSNYLRGDEGSFTGIPNYARVVYREVYPGVDAVFYGKQGQVEYDLVLRPGARPSTIELRFKGARKLAAEASGDLLIETALGTIRQHKPVVYQDIGGERKAVAARYRVLPGQRVKFEVDGYDARHPLTIDPLLSYSTYLGGGSSDEAMGVAVDASGSAYLVGSTSSTNFPLAATGGYSRSLTGTGDLYVAKLNPQGTGLVYSTYIGGRRSGTLGRGIAVDAAGNAYVTGWTSSNAYPTTSGAFSAGISGGGGVLTKLNPAGSALVYSTYLRDADTRGIAVDATGSAYVVGASYGNLPATAGALQASSPGGKSGFVARFNPAGSALVYATYLGGAGEDEARGIAVDAQGHAYVTGHTLSDDFPVTAGAFQPTRKGESDAFLSKLAPDGASLVTSTYLGGSVDDYGNAIAIDASGRAYVAGDTFSIDFPRVQGMAKQINQAAYNVGFVSAFNADLASLRMSTYIGGSACSVNGSGCYPDLRTDVATGIAVDGSGNHVYVTGSMSSIQVFSLTDPIQRDKNGSRDAFAAKMVLDGFSGSVLSLRYFTRLGGEGEDEATGIAIDPQGNAYVAGYTWSTAFPTTAGAVRVAFSGGTDSYLAKLSTLGEGALRLDGGCGDWRGPQAQLRASLALDATGEVAFMNGASTVATVAIQNGAAVYTGPVAPGVHSFTAVKAGDASSVSAPLLCKLEQQ